MKIITKNGYSLIELIIFIFILAISIGVLLSLLLSLKTTPIIDRQTQALELAKQRMEIIYSDRMKNGYANFIDPCKVKDPPAICNTSNINGNTISPSGFIVTSIIVVGNLSSSGWSDNTSGIFKKITVNVTGLNSVSLNLLITDY